MNEENPFALTTLVSGCPINQNHANISFCNNNDFQEIPPK